MGYMSNAYDDAVQWLISTLKNYPDGLTRQAIWAIAPQQFTSNMPRSKFDCYISKAVRDKLLWVRGTKVFA
jgi:hypothetical protein